MAVRSTVELRARGNLPVTVVANADSFALACRRLQGNYESTFKHRIAEVRAKFGEGLPAGERLVAVDALDQALEAHARAYVINGVLAALNWRIGSLPEDGLGELVPEAPVLSVLTDTTRFLDYLGLERDTNVPLLIVETKRPSSALPHLTGKAKAKAANYAETIGLGLQGTALSGDWDDWLKDLRDYVRTAAAQGGQYPRRAVITNGDWFVIFTDPADSFGNAGTHDPSRILVIEGPGDIQARSGEVFSSLAHQFVTRQAPALKIGTVAFEVTGAKVRGVMHGVRLRYSEHRAVYAVLPTISVAPVLFLRLTNDSFIRVESPPLSFDVPQNPLVLANHLHDVHAAAMDLRNNVNGALGIDLPAISLDEHYADPDAFAGLKGVVESDTDDFIVVTGTHTHYMRETSTVPACPYHDSARAIHDTVAAQPVLLLRSMEPRSFSVSGELHHCAHVVVSDAKSNPITGANTEQCGPRSGQTGHAFCEIFRFETRLCCRTCAFETVCTKAQVLNVMPCQRPA